jgi:signal transduction histidine kinase/DNA-binding response OmpR family regulator
MSIGPTRLTIACAIALSAVIAAGTGLFLSTSRSRALVENQRELANTALILARQIESVFSAVATVQSGTLEQIADFGGMANEAAERRMARHDVHIKLRDKAAGMPFVGSLVLINAQGKVVNFSRQWPVPAIEAADRDFYRALRDDPRLDSYLGAPVRNRANGTFVMQFARKVPGPKGEFLGLISGAVELKYFDELFGDISLAPGGSIEVYRDDATLMLRHPRTEAEIGQRFPDAAAIRLVTAAAQGAGRDAGGGEDLIVAAHRVAGYPVVVSVRRTTAAILADWRRTATYLAGIAALTIVALAGIAILFIRLFGNYDALMRSRAEQEKAEQLREQSMRFDVALSNMSQGLCMFDAKQRLIVCNARYAELYGLTQEQTKPGTTLRAILEHRIAAGNAPEDHQNYVKDRLHQVAGNKPYQITQTLRDGRCVSIVHQPMEGGGWVGTHEDVTSAKRAEAERVQAIAEAELFHARELAAEAANKAKSSFLAVMSHEIRTPMNAVIGLSSVLLDSGLNDEQRHIAETIHESSNNLHALLNDILDVSKLDAGKIEFEAAPFSLRAVIDNVTSIVEASAAKKQLPLRCLIDDAMPPALIGDQTRIRQVVLNLMTNAIKFSDKGAVEIAARCVERASGAVTVECAVRDCGIGIAPEQLGKLFGDFSQADSSISRRFGGTGLGLAICKRIIDQMGGDIQVESTLGVGTTFRFALTLPIAAEADLGGNDSTVDRDDFAAVLTTLAEPLRVLLAEDNPTNQLVFAKLMASFNVDVTIAANGREAVRQASGRMFDIVFMDMRMPEMDGLEAARAIRALGGEWTRIPIVALTANAFADDVKACRDAGMDEFIAKPMRKKVLIEKLAVLLAGHPLLVRPARPAASAAATDTIAALPVTPAAEVTLADVAPEIDIAVLRCLAEEIDAEGVRAALDMFFTDTPDCLALMRRLTLASDRARIKDEAHRLKGAAGTFGLAQLSELARTLELSANAIGAEDYGDLLDRLEACFQRARREAVRAVATALAR